MSDTEVTEQDLIDERARVLAQIDDVLATAEADGRSELSDDERTQHDTLASRADELEAEIGRLHLAASDDQRRARHAARSSFVPMVNITQPNATANRSLDEILWATAEDVPAGSWDKTGRFMQHHGARAAVEPVVLHTDDGRRIEAPRVVDFRPEHQRAVRNFQRTVADMCFFGLMVDKGARSSEQGFEVARSHKLMRPRWEAALRAMDVDTSAEGGTWVPTGIGASLHEKVRAAGKVAPLFPRIDLPTNPWKWPIEGADATAYVVPEPTGDTASKMTASTPGSVAATFDAEIFGARALFSRSLEADSAVAILPYVQRKLVLAFVDAEEKAVLDGDEDGTHQDSDVGASTTDARVAWDGLRKKALAQTAQATTTTTSANLALIRKAMAKWGVNPADLAFIVGVSAYHALVTDTNLLTVDKMGPNATIHNGQVGSVFGIPVIVSEWVRENLNATGVYDGITTTKTYNLCVNRSEWAFGSRMALNIEVDDSIYRETFQRVLVGFMREDFRSITDAVTNEETSVGYNVTP